jgi:hypothetical protein
VEIDNHHGILPGWRGFLKFGFALSLSKGMLGVAGFFSGRLTVGRGLPGSKFLFLSRQEKKPKEGDPNIPEFPEIEPAGRAAKNSPRFCWVDSIL